MNKIPRIIHQVWSGINEPLPAHFRKLGETWKRDYPQWEYILWDDAKMNSFIRENYPQYEDIYRRFPYDVQRWDAIRYLILEKMGGMYVDFDYESLEPLDSLIEGKTCCFSQEPRSHCLAFHQKVDSLFNNAMMMGIPGHPFIRNIIDVVFTEEILACRSPKTTCVLETTGPWMLVNQYNKLSQDNKNGIYLVPDKYVTPFDFSQAHRFLAGERDQELEDCLEEAYAVHYFFGGWVK